MKNILMSLGAGAIFVLTPVAAYADCKGGCKDYCGDAHPSNPAAYAICYDGCMAGCTIGPTEPTTGP